MENKHYEPVAYLPKEQAERFQEFLKFSGIADIEMNVNELNSTYSVSVASGDFEKADNLTDFYNFFSGEECTDLEIKFYNKDGNECSNMKFA